MKGQRTSTNHNFINNARSPTQEEDLTSDRGGERFRSTNHCAIIDHFAPNYSCFEFHWLMTSPITQNTSCLQCGGQDLSAFVPQVVAAEVQDAKFLEHWQRLDEIGHVVFRPTAAHEPWRCSIRASGFEHDQNCVVLQRCGRLSYWLQWSVISWCGA